jgi:hypothetical protein
MSFASYLHLINSRILEYEHDELSDEQIIELFQNLATSGLVERMSDEYRNEAYRLADLGYIELPTSGLAVDEEISEYEAEMPSDSRFRHLRKRNPKKHRPIYEIAREIERDWKNPYFGAKPYLQSMARMDQIGDDYYLDEGRDVVLRFLANAQSWRGDTAKQIKAELKEICSRRQR